MLTGRDLRGTAVSSASPHLRSEVIHASGDGRYLFLSLGIARDARPGKYLFRVTSAAGVASFQFTLDPPLPEKGRFRGLTQDDIIYLLMPDRFANADPSNDSPPEFGRPADRSSEQSYHGGDFRGVRQRLGYLKDLGITTIWMLPFYKNSSQHSSPAHGYHTVDFYAVEPRFGTIDELRELVDAAHRAGIKVMQDQVANHCGPYHPWVEAPPSLTWFHGLDLMPRLRNNFDIAALADPYAPPARRRIPLEGWFAGHLPDFNQDDPLIRDYIIQNALWWVGTTGIDGIRQDTYPYVDRAFWEKWQEAIDRQFPNLFVVGEITATTPAVLSFFEGGTRREGVDTRLDSMLDFPLYRAIRRVFAQQQPMAELVDVLAQDSLYRRPEWLVPFLGNHDEPRFLSVAGGDIYRLLLAQAFLLTTRGIPHLYYGDEIAMGRDDGGTSRSVRADFPGGFPGDRIDAFTPEGRTGDSTTVFTALRRLIRFRAEHPALRRGKLVQLLVEKDRYAYLRLLAGGAVLILLNREGPGRPATLNLTGLQLRDGLRLRAFDDASKEVAISDGKVSIQQPRAIEIYAASMNR